MAVEVLANELNFNHLRIDLSTVVSKYIGETERNLKKLFDAADTRTCSCSIISSMYRIKTRTFSVP